MILAVRIEAEKHSPGTPIFAVGYELTVKTSQSPHQSTKVDQIINKILRQVNK